ncbi:MAG: hypothetical protein LF888_00265 [Candidatus Megaira endosymbiont of Mesostigma viride]|nr:MAG: hypothetical protein LF888_00265 [Candidatus Megaira endosymbiont of Mesostigma viride]HJK88210.1 hypothetical protein [Candidatus Megaira endosymbiont of Mesostigma viride]
MNKIVDKIIEAQQYAISIRTKAGGFPILAEVLRQAGVIEYEVDFITRKVTYYGVNGESYLEEYPTIEITR